MSAAATSSSGASAARLRRVLITGGAGFIGSRLALRLRADGYEVTVLDNLAPQVHTQQPEGSSLYRAIAGQVRFVRGDVTDRGQLQAALREQDAVVHLAAETGTGQSMYEIERYCRVNVGGTAQLLELLANSEHQVRRLLVASSRAIYGEGKYLSADGRVVYPPPRVAEDMSRGDFAVKEPGSGQELAVTATDEESRLHPASVYGVTKLTQEQLVLTACPGIGVAPVALRYQNVYGPGQSLSNPYTGILSIFSNLIMSRKALNVFEDGLESRDFVYVDDAVQATVLALEHEAAVGEAFNVGSGRPVSVHSVAQTLVRLLGIAVPIGISGNFRIGDVRHNYACLKKITDRLGFVPQYDFEHGAARFCEWASAMGSASSAYETSLAEMRARGLLK
jgi:dTDP-L-rhamnose 4-epimerase